MAGRRLLLTNGDDVSQAGDVQDSVSNRDYVLNPDKCLRKKLQAAKRQQIEYAVKDGGIVATMDAVSFELFRYSCKEYYDNPKGHIVRVDRDSAKDSRGNIVQLTYTVHLKDNISYTVNMYLTKCSLLINGKATNSFIDIDLDCIHQLMGQVTIHGVHVNAQELNRLLALQLQKLLAGQMTSKIKTSNTRKRRIGESEASASESSIICPTCTRNCRNRAVQCDSCNRWLHYYCEKLDRGEIESIENSKDYVYKCKTCIACSSTHRLAIPTPYRSPTSGDTQPKTLTESILLDETTYDCVICCKTLNGDEAACDKCGSICHSQCMDISNSEICLACAATDKVLQTTIQECTSQNLSQKVFQDISVQVSPRSFD
ncbi:MAG: hypothetical protein AB2693_34840 [Candidatus Thiodiazotropha sp.]